MKEIKTNIIGMHLVCDDEDFDFLRRFTWTAVYHNKCVYACTFINGRSIEAHVLLMNPPKGIQVDHIDRYGLNCQRINLRFARNSQNQYNKGKQKGSWSSKYKGVSYKKKLKKWVARIHNNGFDEHLGCFKSEIEAAKEYDRAAKEYQGKFAVLNFPENKIQ